MANVLIKVNWLKEKIVYFFLKDRDVERDKRSFWLNLLAFILPCWGILGFFACLVKTPNRAIGVLIWTLWGLFFQLLFFITCKVFLFKLLGDFLIVIIG